MSDHEPLHEDDVSVAEARPEVKKPKKYQVILLNDDYTPMEFVVQILQKFFGHNNETANRIMLSVHVKGKGICGVYSHEVAETKVAQVNEYSRQNQHPLMCEMEEAE